MTFSNNRSSGKVFSGAVKQSEGNSLHQPIHARHPLRFAHLSRSSSRAKSVTSCMPKQNRVTKFVKLRVLYQTCGNVLFSPCQETRKEKNVTARKTRCSTFLHILRFSKFNCKGSVKRLYLFCFLNIATIIIA